MMALLRLAWPYLACLLLGLSGAWYIQNNRWHAKELEANALHVAALKQAATNQDKAVAAAYLTADSQCTKTLEVSHGFQNQKTTLDKRARLVTERVYSATCNNLHLPANTAETSGADRGDSIARLDRSQLAALIELARRCESNTAAAITLDSSWPK